MNTQATRPGALYGVLLCLILLPILGFGQTPIVVGPPQSGNSDVDIDDPFYSAVDDNSGCGGPIRDPWNFVLADFNVSVHMPSMLGGDLNDPLYLKISVFRTQAPNSPLSFSNGDNFIWVPINDPTGYEVVNVDFSVEFYLCQDLDFMMKYEIFKGPQGEETLVFSETQICEICEDMGEPCDPEPIKKRNGFSPAYQSEFGLSKLYPNPARSQVVLAYELIQAVPLSLLISDLQGRQLAAWEVPAPMEAGLHRTKIDLSDLAPGVYLIHLRTAHSQTVKRLLKQ